MQTLELSGNIPTELATKKQARLEEIAGRIREKYNPFLTDEEILEIDRAERELAECDNCKGYPCRKASYKGFVPVIEIQNDNLIMSYKQCERARSYYRQRDLERKFKNSKVPQIYLGKKLGDYKTDKNNKHAVEFAKDILSKGLSGAYFWGEVGTGKTLLAAIIAQEFLQAGKSVLFESVYNLLSEFYEIYRGKSDKSEEELLNELYTAQLLVLDDFGMEKATQFVGATLSKIMDARYNRRGITTLITSNYSLEQIKARLNKPTDAKGDDICLNGSRIYDRCIEICKPIHLKGESRRE